MSSALLSSIVTVLNIALAHFYVFLVLCPVQCHVSTLGIELEEENIFHTSTSVNRTNYNETYIDLSEYRLFFCLFLYQPSLPV